MVVQVGSSTPSGWYRACERGYVADKGLVGLSSHRLVGAVALLEGQRSRVAGEGYDIAADVVRVVHRRPSSTG